MFPTPACSKCFPFLPRSICCEDLHSTGVTRLLRSRPPSLITGLLPVSPLRLITHTRLDSDYRAKSSVIRLVNLPPSLLLDAVLDPGVDTSSRLYDAVSVACVPSESFGLPNHYFGAYLPDSASYASPRNSFTSPFPPLALGVEFPFPTLSVVERVPIYSLASRDQLQCKYRAVDYSLP